MKMNRWFITVGVIICLACLLLPIGCDDEEEAGEPTPEQVQYFEWTFQTTEQPGMVSYDKVFPEFVESVEKMSDGRLKHTMHPGGALVPLMEIHNAVADGVVEMGFSTGAFWAGTVPVAVLALGLPYSCETMEEMEAWYYERGALDVLREAYAEQNVHLLAPLIGVPYGSIMSSEPIRSLADLDGMKIRTIGYFGKIWESAGAVPTTTDIAEIYTSIAQGIVDGANIGNPARFAAINLQEVAKYFTMPPLSAYASGEFFVNMDKWNELPEDLQEILTVAAQRASTGFATYFAYEDAEALRTFADAGVEINYFSEEDQETLREASVAVWDQLAQQDEYTERIVDITKEYLVYLGRLD
ncbi:MAG: TRAP transporter substrate-binding protein DctP [Dehalococcoidia bacterium]|nr:MAG: TRAP transporter substrate-binding protein DctP [Dehalococcoidia bacterium]